MPQGHEEHEIEDSFMNTMALMGLACPPPINNCCQTQRLKIQYIDITPEVCMNLLLVDAKKNVRDLLIKKLFPMGITVYHLSDLDKVLDFISDNSIKILVLDLDLNLKQGLQLIKTIGSLPIKPIRTVISSITDKKIIIPLVSFGIAGYFLKPFTEEKGLPRLGTIINKIEDKNELRKYHRVSPTDNEENRVFLRLAGNSKLLSGSLLNISAGGVAISCNETIPDELMKKDDFIQKIQLKLGSNDLILSGNVIFKKGNVFAINFKKCSEEDLFTVSKYIFDKISETV